VVVLDVEDFADVNATLGPRGADTALHELATRLVARTEIAGATLARVDGDRFGWILPGVGESAALAFIRRIATVADAPFHVDGHVVGLRVTLGIALLSGVLTEAAELTRHAIIAMQRARDEHATFAFFDSAMDRDPDAPFGRGSNLFELTGQARERERGGESGSKKEMSHPRWTLAGNCVFNNGQSLLSIVRRDEQHRKARRVGERTCFWRSRLNSPCIPERFTIKI